MTVFPSMMTIIKWHIYHIFYFLPEERGCLPMNTFSQAGFADTTDSIHFTKRKH